MSITRKPITKEQVQADLKDITFKSRNGTLIKLNYHKSIADKYGFQFGEAFSSARGEGIFLGEEANLFWCYLLGDGGISFFSKANNVVKRTSEHVLNQFLSKMIFKISNYREILTERKRANLTQSEIEKEAVLDIQRIYRGIKTRRDYAIQNLSSDISMKWRTCIIGDDPEIAEDIKDHHKKPGEIALIGTSGFRSIEIVAKLCDGATIPKIFIVDTSIFVYQFWINFKNFMEQTIDQHAFLNTFPAFLGENNKYFQLILDEELTARKQGVKYPNQDVFKYLNKLFKDYGYDFIKATVKHASIIRQDWADPSVFTKIKNILNLHGIKHVYAYASNIANGILIHNEKGAERVLENVEKLNPVFAIHTDIGRSGFAEKVYLFENNDKAKVAEQLFAERKKILQEEYSEDDNHELFSFDGEENVTFSEFVTYLQYSGIRSGVVQIIRVSEKDKDLSDDSDSSNDSDCDMKVNCPQM